MGVKTVSKERSFSRVRGRLYTSAQTKQRAQRDWGGRLWGLAIGGFAIIGGLWLASSIAVPLLALALAALVFGVVQDHLPRSLKLAAPVAFLVAVLLFCVVVYEGWLRG
jgi:predicted PurR-regulated permease PerM